jgi:hypothetical protein
MGEASSRGVAFIRGDWLAVVHAAAAEAAACGSRPGSDRMVMSVDRHLVEVEPQLRQEAPGRGLRVSAAARRSIPMMMEVVHLHASSVTCARVRAPA